MSMVLIDLSNFFNGLVAESSVDPGLTKAYFIDWLDLELLASAINPDPSASIGTWIFYSNRAMGRGPARLSPEELTEFAKRHNRISGISAIDVGIPGEQGESFRFTCSKCGAENETQTQSEKGIDSTLITQLFEKMEYWKTATIVSQDVDYCPAVRALRNRGKLVYGAGFIKRAGEALITECFGYKDVMREYIQEDMSLFLLFKKGGRLSEFVKTACGVNGVRPSSRISTISWPRGETGGRWSMDVHLIKEEVISSEQESLLLGQTEVIKREFPFVVVRTKHACDSLIEMHMPLNPRQLKSLIRARERYLDFELEGLEGT
jgi:hypothetical protein